WLHAWARFVPVAVSEEDACRGGALRRRHGSARDRARSAIRCATHVLHSGKDMGAAGDQPFEAGHSHILKRPRLTRLLDEATAGIVMPVAPAGDGKTTLAREWLAERPHGWYRGTQAAADVAALAVGLARAASTIVPDAGGRMKDRIRATGTPDVEPLAELLAEDLEDWPAEAWIAFDDYQFAPESPLAERFVDLLLG